MLCVAVCLQVFMLSSEAVINDELLKQAIDRGHSRVPVYEGSRQVGWAAGDLVLAEGGCTWGRVEVAGFG